ncbi:MAG: putative ABC transporter permease [Ruminococcus sp.]|nr:putative ABC transporter permease [Ruminococcus sp.]
MIYAFLGWCLEVTYQAVEHGKFINRGFLGGPYCPIYGVGVIIVTLALYPLRGTVILLYIGSVVLTSSLELITGCVLERIFHQQWWDYSDEKFNVGGYICLKFSLLWGVACLVTVRIIHPTIEKLVDIIPPTAGIVAMALIYVGFTSDLVITIMGIMHIRRRLRVLEGISAEMRKISDKTGEKLFVGVDAIHDKSGDINEKTLQLRKRAEELLAKYKELTSQRSRVGRRLEHAFPKLKIAPPKALRAPFEAIKAKLPKKPDKKGDTTE